MADRSVLVRLRADISDFERKMAAAGGGAAAFANRLDQADSRMANLVQTGLALAPALVPISGLAVPAIAGLSAQLGFAATAAGVTLLAFQGVGGALDALNKYQLEPTAANFQAVQEKMATLGPEGQEFVRTLQSLRPEMQHLQDISQGGMFPGMTEGIDEAMELMPQAERLIGTVSSTIGDLFAEAGDNLNDPRWVEFFEFLDAEAGPTLEAMGKSFGNVVEGLSAMMVAFDPLADDFTGGMLDMSRSFNQWAQGLDSSQGFQEFLDYIEDTGPEALDTLEAIGGALIALVKAAAPVGQATLPIIEGLADGLAAIADSPVGPVLIASAAAVGVLGRSMALLSAVGLRGGDSLMARIFAVDKIRAGIGTTASMAVATERLSAAEQKRTTAISPMTRAVNELRTAEERRTVAAQRAVTAQTALIPTSEKRAAVASYAAANEKVAKASAKVALAERQAAAARRAAVGQVAKNAALIGGLALATTGYAEKTGLANTVTLGLMGTIAGPWGAAIGGGIGLTMDLASANDDLEAAVQAANRAMESGSMQERNAGFQRLRKEVSSAKADVEDFKDLWRVRDHDGETWFANLGGAVRGMKRQLMGGTKASANELEFLRGRMKATGDYADIMGDAVGLTGRQLRIAAGDAQELSDALAKLQGWLDKRAAIRNYEGALDELRAGLRKNATAWNASTEAGRANLDLVDQTVTGILQMANTMKNADVRTRFLADARQDLVALSKQFPGARRQIEATIGRLDRLGLTRPKPQVDLDTSAADAKSRRTRNELEDLHGQRSRPTIDADNNPARQKTNSVDRWLQELTGTTARPGVIAETGQARAGISAVSGLLAGLDGDVANVYINTIRTTILRTVRQLAPISSGFGFFSADGSTVPKTGLPYADRHPYMLADGEEITSNRRGQADRYRQVLKAINADLPRDVIKGMLADGGTAGARGLADGGTASGSDDRKEAREKAREKAKERAREAAQARKDFQLQGSMSTGEIRRELREFAKAIHHSGGRVGKSFDHLGKRAINLSERYDKAKSDLDRLRELRSSARDSFNNDPFTGSLFDFNTQVGADTNDARKMARALRRAGRKGLDGSLAEGLAASGNLLLAQEFAGLSRAEIRRKERTFESRTMAQRDLGQAAVTIAGLPETAREVRHLTQRLNDIEHRIEGAVRRGAHDGTADRERARNRDAANRARTGR